MRSIANSIGIATGLERAQRTETFGNAADPDVRRRVYDAECALHAARKSGVDAWISAAADRLHEAITQLPDALVSN